MKTLISLLLTGLSFGAVAQSYVHKEIDDNGKRLRIRVDVEKNGQSVHYKQDFDAKAMSQTEKDQLVSRIMDSLGVAEVRTPKRTTPTAATARSRTVYTSSSSDCDTETHSAKIGYASSKEGMEQVAGKVPYQKLIREDRENNRLWMHFEYTVNGEERVFERTVNVEGKTEAEKKRIVEETERSLTGIEGLKD